MILLRQSVPPPQRYRPADEAGRFDADVPESVVVGQAFSGVVMTVVASQVVGVSDRSEAMFAAMGTRHLQHALDLLG